MKLYIAVGWDGRTVDLICVTTKINEFYIRFRELAKALKERGMLEHVEGRRGNEFIIWTTDEKGRDKRHYTVKLFEIELDDVIKCSKRL